MKNKTNATKIIRRVSTLALLLIVIIQLSTVILLETGFDKFEIGEVHEICGFILLGTVVVHIIIFRKSLKSILFPGK